MLMGAVELVFTSNSSKQQGVSSGVLPALSLQSDLSAPTQLDMSEESSESG
jgi:hypothetical protein